VKIPPDWTCRTHFSFCFAVPTLRGLAAANRVAESRVRVAPFRNRFGPGPRQRPKVALAKAGAERQPFLRERTRHSFIGTTYYQMNSI